MRKGESGQAFILVLIILAIGSMLVVPALRLTGTSLKSSEVVAREVRALYAADGAQEYVLWKLEYDAYGGDFTADGQSDNFTVDVCGTPVDVTVIMRAVEGEGAVILATDDVIRPTKAVNPDSVPNSTYQTFTYTIKLEQLSDNTTQGLDAVYDILPKPFTEGDYMTGSSEIRVDGGSWEPFDDPLLETVQNQVRMRWPNPNTYGSENFTSPIRDFEIRQVKEIRFQVADTLPKDSVQCNWVVLKPWNTLSGPQASIAVGSPDDPEVCDEDGLFYVSKVSDPEVIQPGVEADINYTIIFRNNDGFTHQVQSLTDYLPPGFLYSENTTSGVTTMEPQVTFKEINGADRYELLWDFSPAISVASGATENMTFWASTTKDVSGSYYNEILMVSDAPVPKIFQDLGITEEDFTTSYSWTTGAVIVPAYDSRADADQITVDANMALILGGISITSWQIY